MSEANGVLETCDDAGSGLWGVLDVLMVFGRSEVLCCSGVIL